MVVELTSPVLGLNVGDEYTGTLEPWLLAEGYARQDDYVGPGVSNTGPSTSDVDEDPTNAANREAPHWTNSESEADHNATIANDVDNLTELKFPNPDFDFDLAGDDDDAPSNLVLTPSNLALAGGVVTVTGDNLEGVTAVTVGGTAGTALNVTEAANGEITFTAPAKAAGAHNVVFTDADGNATVTGGLTYA